MPCFDIIPEIAAKIGEKVRFGSQKAQPCVSILRHTGLSLIGDRQEGVEHFALNRADDSMDTTRTSSYVALKLTEIQRRFDDDLAGITLEDGEIIMPSGNEGYDPYGRS